MFSVVAMKCRTFPSLPCSADEQVCRSWEGAEPGSQPKLASRNISYHGHHARFMNGGWIGGRKSFFFSPPFPQIFCEFGLFLEVHKIREIHKFLDHCSGIDYAIGHQAVTKKVVLYCVSSDLHIDYY